MSDQHTDMVDTPVEVVDGEIVGTAIVPYTGEVLALPDLTDEQLASVLDDARQFEQAKLRLFKRDLQDEVLKRMDAQAEWTIHTDHYDINGDSPDRTDYDGEELQKVLASLVKAGEIDQDAADRAIVSKLELPGLPDEQLLARAKKVEYVAAKKGLNALKKLGGVVRDAIESCERPTDKSRAVRVTLRPGVIR